MHVNKLKRFLGDSPTTWSNDIDGDPELDKAVLFVDIPDTVGLMVNSNPKRQFNVPTRYIRKIST